MYKTNSNAKGEFSCRILIAGLSGMVGMALGDFLRGRGHTVVGLTRSPSRPGWIQWDPGAGKLNADELAGFDAVVNLAGEGIADGRWSASRKRAIRESRMDSTRLLVRAMGSLAKPPSVFISASGANYYPANGIEYDESGPAGTGFLTEVCKDWEAASGDLTALGIRRVLLRLGVVLHPEAGALAKMLPLFRLGLGGRIGDGKQHMSWIAINDVVRIIGMVIERTDLSGPVNVVAPASISNADFAATLARVLNKPTWLATPAFVLRTAFGQMADETLLADQRLVPGKLKAVGYDYCYPDLEAALRAMLRKSDHP